MSLIHQCTNSYQLLKRRNRSLKITKQNSRSNFNICKKHSHYSRHGMLIYYSYYYTYVEIQFKDLQSTSTFKSFVRYMQYGKQSTKNQMYNMISILVGCMYIFMKRYTLKCKVCGRLTDEHYKFFILCFPKFPQ